MTAEYEKGGPRAALIDPGWYALCCELAYFSIHSAHSAAAR